MSNQEMNVKKIVFVGENQCGKSSIIRRIESNTFSTDYVPTHTIDFKMRYLKAKSPSLTFGCWTVCWDIAGQQEISPMNKVYYKDAESAVIVFDINQPDPLGKIIKWFNDLRNNLPQRIPIHVVGNKSEIYFGKEKEIREFCEKNKIASYTQVSAKDGNGIIEIIHEITKGLIVTELDENVIVTN